MACNIKGCAARPLQAEGVAEKFLSLLLPYLSSSLTRIPSRGRSVIDASGVTL